MKLATLAVLTTALCTVGWACQADSQTAGPDADPSALMSDASLASILPALAYGETRDLNASSGSVDPQLLLRLYSQPSGDTDCVAETRLTCAYQHFLTVSTFDEQPELALHELDLVGEVTGVEWLPSSDIDTARLRLTLSRYTSQALRLSPELDAEPRDVVLRVDVDRVAVE